MSTRGPLFDPLFGSAAVAEIVSDQAWVSALLTVEAAVSAAAADVGIVTAAQAAAVGRAVDALVVPGAVDITALGRNSAVAGNPVLTIVDLLRAQPGLDATAVHVGATSQDVMDSAAVLLARAAGAGIVHSARVAAADARSLASLHRTTATVARTLGQQALPTTFGCVAAGWTLGLARAADDLERAVDDLGVQFGGAAGTLAAVHPHGQAMADAVADHLGLPRQLVPWHTERTPFARVGAALGVLCGVVGKCAGDVVLLASTEVAEVSEQRPGTSSAMPHKQNPVAAITARADALRAPGLVSTLLATMSHEHQRAAGAWHAEWETLTDLLRVCGGAVTALARSLSGLEVHTDAMRRNLSATGGLLLAERVSVELSRVTPDGRAIVTEACRAGTPLDEDPAIIEHLSADTVRGLLDPSGYLGHATDIVDRVLGSVPDINTGGFAP